MNTDSPRIIAALTIMSILSTFPLGAQWVQTFDNPTLALIASGPSVFAGTTIDGVFRSTSGGTTWTSTNNGPDTLLGNPVNAFTSVGSTVFAGSRGGGVFRTTDGGLHWTQAVSGLSDWGVMALAAVDTTVFAATLTQGVFRSSDYGESWGQCNDGIRALAGLSCFASGSRVFFGTRGGSDSAGFYGYIYQSSDNGENWIDIGAGLSGAGVYSIASIDTMIFVGTRTRGVYRSGIGTYDWVRVNDGIASIDVAWCLMAYEGNLICGMENANNTPKLYVSPNQGISWENMSANLPNTGSYALEVYSDTLLLAGGIGIFRRPLSEMVTSARDLVSPTPERCLLHHNYPNPFNPSTTIRYALSQRSHVTLTVLNLLGQQIATLVRAEQDAGYHEVLFDGSGLASGVYLYRIQADSYSATKALVLVR